MRLDSATDKVAPQLKGRINGDRLASGERKRRPCINADLKITRWPLDFMNLLQKVNVKNPSMECAATTVKIHAAAPFAQRSRLIDPLKYTLCSVLPGVNPS